jgi:hypothetical protein
MTESRPKLELDEVDGDESWFWLAEMRIRWLRRTWRIRK